MAPNMAPMYGQPNYEWSTSPSESTEDYTDDDSWKVEETNINDLGKMAFWYMMVLIIMLLTWLCIFFCLRVIAYRQKTRNTQQQRRVYVPGSRQRQLSVQGEPTIFVSPANLPPPPKYEAMAPPSYEEVMGVHYPGFQQGQQPITQPLTHALAQGSTSTETTPSNVTINVTSNVSNVAPPAVVTITTEDRPAVRA